MISLSWDLSRYKSKYNDSNYLNYHNAPPVKVGNVIRLLAFDNQDDVAWESLVEEHVGDLFKVVGIRADVAIEILTKGKKVIVITVRPMNQLLVNDLMEVYSVEHVYFSNYTDEWTIVR